MFTKEKRKWLVCACIVSFGIVLSNHKEKITTLIYWHYFLDKIYKIQPLYIHMEYIQPKKLYKISLKSKVHIERVSFRTFLNPCFQPILSMCVAATFHIARFKQGNETNLYLNLTSPSKLTAEFQHHGILNECLPLRTCSKSKLYHLGDGIA